MNKIKIIKLFLLIALITPLIIFPQDGIAKKRNNKRKNKKQKEEITRIISLKPNITKTLIALGLNDKIVGITKFCDTPNHTATIVADYKNINVEEIAKLNPTIIISSLENSNSKQYYTLESKGYKTLYLNFQSLNDLKSSITKLGAAFHKEDQAKSINDNLDLTLTQIKSQSEKLLHKTFAIIVQRRPLMVANGQNFLSSLFESIGLKNAFSNNAIKYPVIDEEVFIREDVNFAFDISHNSQNKDSFFLNKNVIPIDIKNFIATPQAINSFVKLIEKIKNPQQTALSYE